MTMTSKEESVSLKIDDSVTNELLEKLSDTDKVRFGKTTLPVSVFAQQRDISLSKWLKKNKALIDSILHCYGAIRFIGFGIDSAEDLEEIAYSYSDDVLDYVERGASRKRLGKNIFSSTAYAKEEHIPLHHEMSYANRWPSKLFFACEKPAQTQGYTPLVDDRRVYNEIPEDIKEKFDRKKIMYVRNYGLGVDMGWREAFNTDDKVQVERYLQETETEYQWLSDEHLRTVAIRQVSATHPLTGDKVWFNHAHLFHSSNMPEDVREFLIEEFTSEGLPRNVFYGDGTQIEDEYIRTISNLYCDSAKTFEWERGDLLLVDNFLICHGRTPFTGERKILVAMTDLYDSIKA